MIQMRSNSFKKSERSKATLRHQFAKFIFRRISSHQSVFSTIFLLISARVPFDRNGNAQKRSRVIVYRKIKNTVFDSLNARKFDARSFALKILF